MSTRSNKSVMFRLCIPSGANKFAQLEQAPTNLSGINPGRHGKELRYPANLSGPSLGVHSLRLAWYTEFDKVLAVDGICKSFSVIPAAGTNFVYSESWLLERFPVI